MLKREELSNPNSCMSRALPDERTFVLLARDECAPDTIVDWTVKRIERGLNKETDPQITEAIQCAVAMDRERPVIKSVLRNVSAGASRPVEAQMPDHWLILSAQSLLDLDAKGCLVPHGIGVHARRIIEEFLKLHAVPAPPADTPNPSDGGWSAWFTRAEAQDAADNDTDKPSTVVRYVRADTPASAGEPKP